MSTRSGIGWHGGLAIAVIALLGGPARAADFVNHLGMAFVTVPAGVSTTGGTRFDWPLQVQVTPVTAAQVARVRAAAAGSADPVGADDGTPATGLSWVDAQAFVRWLNATRPASDAGRYRLLGGAEWDHAARGGSATRFGWGDRVEPDRCAHCAATRETLPPVGSFPANGYGLRDMIGYLYEWVGDCRSDEPRAINPVPADGGLRTGPADCLREFRGGPAMGPASPNEGLADAGTAYVADPFMADPRVGFRVARRLPDDPRDPARTEIATVITADDYRPPPPVPVDIEAAPTAESVLRVAMNLLQSCDSGLGGQSPDDVDRIIAATRPTLRGLPLLGYQSLGSGEGTSDMIEFDAPPEVVAAVFPELVAPRRLLTGFTSARGLRRLEDSRVICSWINWIGID